MPQQEHARAGCGDMFKKKHATHTNKKNKTGSQTYTGKHPFFLPDVIFLHLPGISNVHLFSPCPSLSHTQTSTIAAGLISISLQLKPCTQGLGIHCCWKVVGIQLFQVLHIYQPHLHSGQFIMMSDVISRTYILTDVCHYASVVHSEDYCKSFFAFMKNPSHCSKTLMILWSV